MTCSIPNDSFFAFVGGSAESLNPGNLIVQINPDFDDACTATIDGDGAGFNGFHPGPGGKGRGPTHAELSFFFSQPRPSYCGSGTCVIVVDCPGFELTYTFPKPSQSLYSGDAHDGYPTHHPAWSADCDNGGTPVIQ